MKYQLPTVLFITILLATCLAYHKNLRKSLQRDKCFEFDLKKRSKPLQNSLNLINLFSYHEALTKNQETFISFHQKKEKTKKIAMKETLINETHHNKNNSKNISVYLENKYNAEVFFYIYKTLKN